MPLKEKGQAMLQHFIRVFLTFCVFVAIWLLLMTAGASLVDTTAILKGLDESWLKFLHPNMRNVFVSWGWQPLASLILAVLSYRSLKAPAAYFANIISPTTKTYDLSDDASGILKALWRPDYIRTKDGLSRELGFDETRITKGLNQLVSNGLVIERRKRTGLFWKITFEGRAYLKQLGGN